MKNATFRNGDPIPQFGLGTWRSEPSEAYRAVKEALRIGYRHIDCAAIYGNEKEVGQALRDSFREGILRREELFVTSKLWNSHHAPQDVEPAIRQTLSDLGLDYVDLYLIHWPLAFRKGVGMPQSKDDLIPLERIPLSQTWEAMEKLVDGKLARHIGVSNFSIEAIEKLNDGARIRPEMNQIEIHPYMQQDRMVNYCRDTGLLVTAYSPLGSHGNRVLEDPVVVAVAQKHGCTPAQAVLAWLMARDIVVIPKSVHEQRLRENFEATDVALDEDDMRRMASIERHERMSDGSFALFEDGPYTAYDLWGAE
ncbi:MAG: aldo/keto reductase [Alistipes sp.]